MSSNPSRKQRRGPRHRKPKRYPGKRLGLVASGVVAALVAVVAYGGVGAWRNDDVLTVWLMQDAREGWPEVVRAANSALERQHPGVDVRVRYQQWGSYLDAFDARLRAGNPPDVVEFGNTQTVSYMASGTLSDLSAEVDSFDNSWAWLNGLHESCTYQTKLYCIPYYAGSRAVIYRTDMFRRVGIEKPPTSLEEFTEAADKLMGKYGDNKYFSALYVPGKYWYYAMSFVYDYGGQIARQVDGKWMGTLDSKAARTGLKKLEEIVGAYSAAPKTADESEQASVAATGDVAMFYDLESTIDLVTSAETGNPALGGKLGAFAMPSHRPGKTMPSFLGGSDLAIPADSDARGLALDWIRTYTSNRSMRMLVEVGGVLPNTTKLLDVAEQRAAVAAFASAARNTWFVPTAKNWATVEEREVIGTMLVDILTGAATVEDATARASERITRILNAG